MYGYVMGVRTRPRGGLARGKGNEKGGDQRCVTACILEARHVIGRQSPTVLPKV